MHGHIILLFVNASPLQPIMSLLNVDTTSSVHNVYCSYLIS